MTSITQKIQRYTLGVSDQPDELKIPGQLTKAENVIPDVALGLIKRPGFKYVYPFTPAGDGSGKWFHIHKNNIVTGDEQYVGQITPEGKVTIWSLKSGVQQAVYYTNSFIAPQNLEQAGVGYKFTRDYTDLGSEDYFKHEDPDELQVMSVNDYTFVTNRKTLVSMSENTAEKRPYEAYAEIKALAYQRSYTLDFGDINNPAPRTFTSASKVSIAPVGWSTTTNDWMDGGCARAGQWTENLNSQDGTKTNLGVTITSQCQAIPKAAPFYKEVYTLSVDLVNGGEGWEVGDSIEVVVDDNPFRITVDEITTTTTNRASDGRATYYIADTSAVLDADVILSDLKSQIEGLGAGYQVTIIGNGLYIEGTYPFTVTTSDPTLISVMGITDLSDENEDTNYITQVNNVGQLPVQCKDGYIVKVVNTGAEEDDYYVKFIGNNNVDGDGVWEECAKPGIPHNFNPYSMPHCILRLATTTYDAAGNLVAEFLVGPNLWESRLAGDELTNPRPSFSPQPGFKFGRAINSVLFYRDRLVFLSDENVFMSRAGDYFDLWGKSALTVTADDPIDVATSSTDPAMLYAGIDSSAGLVLFGANRQYMLVSDGDILSPVTTKITTLCSYDFNTKSQPVSLGTTTGFLSGSGKYTRFFELYDVVRDGTPTVTETSKTVSTLLPSDMYYIASSKENGMVAMGKPESNVVWFFRYFDVGERRVQASWYNWTLPGELIHHALIYDSYHAVVRRDGKCYLVRADIKELYDTTLFGDEDYRISLDFYNSIDPQYYTYNFSLNKTYFPRPNPYFEGENLVAVTETGAVYPVYKASGDYYYVEGDIQEPLIVGYTFKMDVQFPVLYPTKSDGTAKVSDTRSSLVIHRVRLNVGDIGVSTIELNRFGRESYSQLIESTPEDAYKADAFAFVPDKTITVPVYDRNTNVDLHLTSTHPSPSVLRSLEWEGDYNNRYYRSV